MPVRTRPEHGDRVSWLGQEGTIIDVHGSKSGKRGQPAKEGPTFGVLLDTGPGQLQLWPKDECEIGIGVYPSRCPRCGGPHRAPACQAEYLAFRDRKRAERECLLTPGGH